MQLWGIKPECEAMKKMSNVTSKVERTKELACLTGVGKASDLRLLRGGTLNGKFRKGFTLVEIIVVIAIIAILTSFLIANFTNIRRTTRDAQRKLDLRGIQASLEIYRSDEGSYPPSLPLTGCGDPWVVVSVTYIQSIPCDPLASNTQYNYTLLPSGNYTLVACLENIDDNQKDDADGGGNDTCGIPGTPDGKVSYTLRNP